MISVRDIVVVTVTYGERWSLLHNALESCIREGIRNFIIVGNGVTYNISDRLESCFPDINISLYLSDINKGSAYGFRTGLSEALRSGKDYIMLFDDDAEMQSGCMDRLIRSYTDVVKTYGVENTIVSAVRLEHLSDLTEGILQKSLKQKNAFRRFHLFDLARRLLTRLNIIKFEYSDFDRVSVPYTVYSGLLFNKSLIDRHGLP
ncbi:MAG: glycosyltransferase, partial [Thermodesulfovibrionales bacterium]